MRLIKYHSIDKSLCTEFMELTLRYDFDLEIQSIKKQWNVNNTDWDDVHESEKGWLELLESGDLRAEVEKLVSKLSIDTKFSDWIHEYIVFGSNHSSGEYLDTTGIATHQYEDGRIIIEVGPNSNKKDLLRAWNEIEQHIPKKKRKNKDKLWRDYEIFKLANKGCSISDICIQIQEKFNDDLDYGNIKRIYSEMCVRLHLPDDQKKILHTN
jgi:hypothetical protein